MNTHSVVVILMSLQWSLVAAFGASLFLLPTKSFFPGQRWFGLACAALGLVVFVMAITAHQKRNRSLRIRTVPIPNEKAQLVTGGIYGIVRHPMYLSVLLMAIGAAMVRGQIWLFSLTAVIAGFLSVKSRFEERLLLETYPDYRAYMTRTGRILPRLWRLRRTQQI